MVLQDGSERAGDSVRAVHPAHAQGAAGAGLAARHRAPDRLPRGHPRRQDANRQYPPLLFLYPRTLAPPGFDTGWWIWEQLSLRPSVHLR